MAAEANDTARMLMAGGIRFTHPDWSEERVQTGSGQENARCGRLSFSTMLSMLWSGLSIPYAVVGSYASTAWGEPRMTRDIDIVIQLTAAASRFSVCGIS